MKLLLVLVSAAALGATATTVVLGARLQEPTVVEHPYEEALRHDAHHAAGPAPGAGAAGAESPREAADPSVRPERSAAAGGAESRGELALEIDPRPPRALSELTFTVRATRGGLPLDGARAALSLEMPGMRMGENHVALAPAGGGAYRGKGAVVRCPGGGRTWAADVTVTPADGAPISRRFTFEVAER